MPHAQYLYDRCDEKGLLVWIDVPLHRAFLSDVAYCPTPQFEENGRQQLREIVAQHVNHPSVAMWGIFSRLWMRGDNPVRYLRELNAMAHELDPSRPTVACSDQDGDVNFITDLIVWRQDVGWSKGTPDDVAVWHDRLQHRWSHLRSAIAYGGYGIPGHRKQPNRTVPDPNCMPEERQTRFHEAYSRNLQNDSLFWGVWIHNLFDYGSTRYPYGVDGRGLVTFDRRTCKDAYYLYRAMWNRKSPTLHLTGRHTARRSSNSQVLYVYSSAGVPTLTVGADTVSVHEYAAYRYRSDSITLPAGTGRRTGLRRAICATASFCASTTRQHRNSVRPFCEREVDERQIRCKGQSVCKDLHIRLGHEGRVFSLFGGAGRGRRQRLRHNGRSRVARAAQSVGKALRATRDCSRRGNATRAGRTVRTYRHSSRSRAILCRRRPMPPMLVLPAFGIVDSHVAHGSAGAVGVADLHGQHHRAVGRQDGGAVPFRPLNKMLARVDDATARPHRSEPRHGGQIGEREYATVFHAPKVAIFCGFFGRRGLRSRSTHAASRRCAAGATPCRRSCRRAALSKATRNPPQSNVNEMG